MPAPTLAKQFELIPAAEGLLKVLQKAATIRVKLFR
jgi:hypothetical protein